MIRKSGYRFSDQDHAQMQRCGPRVFQFERIRFENRRRLVMRYASLLTTIVLAAVLLTPTAAARAQDLSKFPDWSGQWLRADPIGTFDPSKPRGRGQQAPLTPEYQAIFEANLVDQANGGHGTDPTFSCIPDGMPRAMNAIFPMEIAILPNTIYILIEYLTQQRRIF